MLSEYGREKKRVNLGEKLKPAVGSKRRGLLSKAVFLHRDGATRHAATLTIMTVHLLRLEPLPYPALTALI